MSVILVKEGIHLSNRKISNLIGIFMEKNKFNGILLINKNKDCTSHDIVDEVRRILKQQAVGHAGTLDPMARGLLVILCGMATKLSPYFLNNDKSYRLSIKFGRETNTFDLQGEVLKSKEVSLKKEEVEKLLKEETRDLEIPVPVFSAVKVKGRKLYSYAFSGKEDEIKPPLKKMSFWGLKIHEIQKDSVSLTVTASKGSYIRSWVHHLGQKTKTGACLSQLERLSSGDFHVNQSLTTDELKQKLSENFPEDEEQLKSILGDSFLFPSSALNQFPQLELTGKNVQMLKQGRMPLYILSATQKDQISVNKKGQAQILKAVRGQKLVALLEMRPFEKVRILKNFPNQNF